MFMKIPEEVFDNAYKPVKNHMDDNAPYTGCMYETFGQELYYVFMASKSEELGRKVWTIVEGDEGQSYVAGFHYVNRLGFLITEREWPSEEAWVELEDLTCQKYTNYYYCGDCKERWEDIWDCKCDDKCPTCNKAYTPYKSEEI